MIIRVTVVPRRTVWGDFDRRFDNLSGSHLQSQESSSSSESNLTVGCWKWKVKCYNCKVECQTVQCCLKYKKYKPRILAGMEFHKNTPNTRTPQYTLPQRLVFFKVNYLLFFNLISFFFSSIQFFFSGKERRLWRSYGRHGICPRVGWQGIVASNQRW